MSREQRDRLAAVFRHEETVLQRNRIQCNVMEWNAGDPLGVIPSPSSQPTPLVREETIPMENFTRIQTKMRLRDILNTKGMKTESINGVTRVFFTTMELAKEFSDLIFKLDTVHIGNSKIVRERNGRQSLAWEARPPQTENDQVYLDLFTRNLSRHALNRNEVDLLTRERVFLNHLSGKRYPGRFFPSEQEGRVHSKDCCKCVVL